MNEAELEDLTTRLLPEKPTLAEAIDFQTDIAPYPLISIWAGVGAGKNYFVEKMITGSEEHNIPRMSVLIITSRKAKVAETLIKMNDCSVHVIDDDHSVDELFPDTYDSYEGLEKHKTVYPGIGTQGVLRSVVCTNAFIENYLKFRHHPSDPLTHIWNRFDVIVWDEAHALLTDSSYQSAPYHVMSLIKETFKRIKAAKDNDALPIAKRNPEIKRLRCKHLIFMTGTPETIEIVPLIWHNCIIDMRSICTSVTPVNIHFLTSNQATQQIRKQLQQGERIVYFSNLPVLPKTASEKYLIPNEKIAVSFSNEEKRKAFESETDTPDLNGTESDFKRMKNIEEYLATHSHIRSDIQLFITTSRNKEGININDTDIHHVYVESHSITDIKQMAGRIRNEAEHLYIIMDSPRYNNYDSPHAELIARQLASGKINSKGKEASQINENLWEFCRWKGTPDLSTIRAYDNEELGKYIDEIKKFSPYIVFDYIDNGFHFNEYRYASKVIYADEIQRFNEASSHPSSLVEFFLDAFPESVVYEPVSPLEQARIIGWDFMHCHPDGNFTQEEFDDLIALLDELLTPAKNRKRRKSAKPDPNRLLHKIGLHYGPRNHNPNSPGYNEYIIEPYNTEKPGAA